MSFSFNDGSSFATGATVQWNASPRTTAVASATTTRTGSSCHPLPTRFATVAVLTAGPGVTNGVSAITQAQFSGSPLVVVGGRAPANRWERMTMPYDAVAVANRAS